MKKKKHVTGNQGKIARNRIGGEKKKVTTWVRKKNERGEQKDTRVGGKLATADKKSEAKTEQEKKKKGGNNIRAKKRDGKPRKNLAVLEIEVANAKVARRENGRRTWKAGLLPEKKTG